MHLSLETLNESQRRQLECELVKTLFSNIPFSVVAIIVNALILCIVLWNAVASTTLIAWFAATSAIMLWRLHLTRRFQRDADCADVRTWHRRFNVGAIASALVWASSAVVLFPAGDDVLIIFLAFVIGGISVGAASTLSADFKLAALFISLLVLPLVVRVGMGDLEMGNQTVHYSIGLMMLIFLTMLIFVVLRMHRNLVDTFMIRLQFLDSARRLEESEKRFSMIFQQVPVGIFYYVETDAKLLINDCNDELLAILHVNKNDLFDLDLNRMPNLGVLEALQAVFDDREGYYNGAYKTMIVKRDIWIELRSAPIYDSEQQIIGGVAIVRDLTKQQETQERIRYLAYHDMLTTLPNRVLLQDRLNQLLLSSHLHNHFGAMLFMDLDNFKQINDSLGHSFGDKILIQAAKRIQNRLRDEDTLSRIGGDEFVVLVPELGRDETQARRTAEALANSIQAALNQTFTISQHALLMTSSIGITVFGDKSTSVEEVMKQADAAMYEAKRRGKDKICFFEPSMNAVIKARLELENWLRLAAEKNELELYLQPITQLADDTIVAAEVLLRWNHPKRGMISPSEFVPLAEETGLIVALGEWVIRQSFRLISGAERVRALDGLAYLSINLSARQIREEGFTETVLRLIDEYDIDPSRIQFEMTESTVIDNFNATMEMIEKLSARNIRFAIDDFGTGYSSLSYLKYLKVDALKIDIEFIRDLLVDPADAKLVSVIIDLSRHFELQIVAEGVEQPEQKAYLADLSHDGLYQGYLCSRPLPVDAFADFLKANPNA